MNPRIILVHLHLDFEKHLLPLLHKWNEAQSLFEFVGLRPSRKLEQILLNPGVISDDEASLTADQIRAEAGFKPTDGIVVFTEKRLFDDIYYQLFVGGREADETPPNVSILSLHFLRQVYNVSDSNKSKFLAPSFRIFFSL